jgi:hypothetical protein
MNRGGVGQEQAAGRIARRVDGGSGVAHWLILWRADLSSQDYHIALVRAFRGAARSGRPLASCTKLSVMAKKSVPETGPRHL